MTLGLVTEPRRSRYLLMLQLPPTAEYRRQVIRRVTLDALPPGKLLEAPNVCRLFPSVLLLCHLHWLPAFFCCPLLAALLDSPLASVA